MDFGINLGMPNPGLEPGEQLAQWRLTLAAAAEAGFTFVSGLHQWLSHPFQFLSPLPTLAWMAGQFPDFHYATGVLQLPVLNPVQLAEDVMTADYLTGGRFILGVGLGYRPELFQAAGADRADRVARFEEAVVLMRALWAEGEVHHDGRFFQCHGTLARRPMTEPPVVVGAQSRGAAERAGRLGDGWYIPSQVAEPDLAELFPVYLDARRAAGKSGAGTVVLTRNVCVAPTDQEAVDHARSFMGDTFGAYRTWGLEESTTVRVHRTFDEEISQRAVVGSVDTCRDRLGALCARFPISHLQLRPQGPGFQATEAGLRDALGLLGRHVLPALA